MSSYALELPKLSPCGSRIPVCIIELQGRTLIVPTPVRGNLLEVYIGKEKEPDIPMHVGEEWEAEVLEHQITTKLWEDLFEPFHNRLIVYLPVKLLRRIEEISGSLDRATKEWVIETKSGLRIVDTRRVPVRILQKQAVQEGVRETIERIVGRDDGKIYFEGVVSVVNIEVERQKELRALKENALRHPSQRE